MSFSLFWGADLESFWAGVDGCREIFVWDGEELEGFLQPVVVPIAELMGLANFSPFLEGHFSSSFPEIHSNGDIRSVEAHIRTSSFPNITCPVVVISATLQSYVDCRPHLFYFE